MREIDKALIFASAAHYAIGQVRKSTGEPYITHPIAVANIVKDYGGNDDMIAAAYLHDTVEDTSITMDIIRDTFSKNVSELVEWLTDISKPSDGNRKLRKALDREHIAQATRDAQFIKCADLIHNSDSIVKYQPDFAKVYMREKELLLGAMTKVHGLSIHKYACDIVLKYYTEDKHR